MKCFLNLKQIQIAAGKMEIRNLTVTFAIMNHFCDIIRLKCRLTGLDKHISPHNCINKVDSIRKCKLHKHKFNNITRANILMSNGSIKSLSFKDNKTQ